MEIVQYQEHRRTHFDRAFHFSCPAQDLLLTPDKDAIGKILDSQNWNGK